MNQVHHSLISKCKSKLYKLFNQVHVSNDYKLQRHACFYYGSDAQTTVKAIVTTGNLWIGQSKSYNYSVKSDEAF